LVCFGQTEYYVSAKGGLNVREQPNSNSKKVATILYGQKVTIESKTGEKLTINDTDKETGITKKIEGEWVEITSGSEIKGYVFDGFLKGDGITYDDDSYRVIITPLPELGSIIKVYDKQKTSKDPNQSKIYGGAEAYFVDIVENLMILDYGSGPDRSFEVYDLQSQEAVIGGDYNDEEGVTIKNSKIYFSQKVEIINERDKPECPQHLIDIGYGLGYIEKLIYNTNKGKLERTGIFKCRYFQ